MTVLLQTASVALNIYIAYTHNTKHIYWLTFIFNAVNLALYIYLLDWAAVIAYVGITLRSYAYIYREKFKTDLLPWVFCLFHMVLGLITADDIWQLLTIAAPCVVCISMWYNKGKYQQLRIGNILNAGLWLFYNWHYSLYILCLARLLTIGSNIAAYIKNRNTDYSATTSGTTS